jgi:aminopeptidase
MTDPRVEKMADLLVRYSCKVQPGQLVSVSGGEAARPLIAALHRRILEARAFPRINMVPDGLDKAFYDLADENQLQWTDPVLRYEYENCDHLIRIMAETNTKALTSVDPARQQLAGKARRPLREIMVQRDRWALTLFPTNAYAQDAEMSLAEFEDFVFSACFLDRPDPVAEWTRLEARQQRIADALNQAKEIRLIGPDTDLTLGVAGRKWLNSSATHNIPSGEVFTGPVEDAVNGRIRYSFPIVAFGREMDDIRLTFRDGRVTEASAAKNEEFLIKMLDSDPGARVLGELGIGTNYGIRRHIKNILFDEKIGGSIHTAVGSSYPQTGGRNVSALHWDLIKDLRTDGEIRVDGRPFQRNGRFLEHEIG